MLGRLRITQRLSLLLMLPLTAVVLISVPFAVERANAARATASIVDSARNARAVGKVIKELEQERLLALGYLASTRLQRSAFVVQMHSTVDAATQARANVAGPDAADLSAALGAVRDLDGVRQRVLLRATTMGEVYRAYHGVVLSLLNTLRLADQRGADAVGLRQMSSLDSLLRLSEEGNQVGAALVVASVDPEGAKSFVTASTPLEQVYAERFRQEGDPRHVALVELSAKVPSAQRAAALAAAITSAGPTQNLVTIDVSLPVAQIGVDIRRALQDRVAGDIATEATRRSVEANTAAAVVAGLALALLISVIWLGIAVSRSVARPLRRITLAATAVADLASNELVRINDIESDDQRPPRLAALTLRSADEIGELASAFNRVQATAALLMEQQVTTRRNVSIMFANIAHRTQSLVARQLAHIDSLERNEPDEQRLASLYPLDHLTTRLRRSADSLMVIAGARDEGRIATPTSIADVIRSAAAEVEGYQNVQLGVICDVTITAAGVPDLTLLLAELLENATAFSPPNVPVEVSAHLHAGCLVRIVDRGIGMSPDRLAEENARIVSRERLDVAPTTMLGLFVVGRLARRHGIAVHLLPTPITGVTVEIAIPPGMAMLGRLPAHLDPGEAGRATPNRNAALPAAPPHASAMRSHHAADVVNGQRTDFGWFHDALPAVGMSSPALNGSAPTPVDASRGGLRRRERGATLADGDPPSVPAQRSPAVRDPEAERADLNGFTQGVARAAGTAQPSAHVNLAGPYESFVDPRLNAAARVMGQPPPQRAVLPRADGVAGPLRQRRPGEHLPESLRAETAERRGRPGLHRQPETPRPARDADAERAALSGYLDGLARAADDSHPSPDYWS